MNFDPRTVRARRVAEMAMKARIVVPSAPQFGRPCMTCDGLKPHLLYDSAEQASLHMGLNKGRVAKAIRMGGCAGGRRWKYCDEVEAA